MPKKSTFISFPKDCDISSTWYFLGGLTGGPTFSVSNMLGELRQGQVSSTDWLETGSYFEPRFLDQNNAE